MKDLGLDVGDVLKLAEYLKNLAADERNSFLESAKIAFDDLKKENLSYRDLSQLIRDKEGEEKELQKRIEDLKKQESEINGRIEELNKDEKIAEEKLRL
jgi:rubrerythrin